MRSLVWIFHSIIIFLDKNNEYSENSTMTLSNRTSGLHTSSKKNQVPTIEVGFLTSKQNKKKSNVSKEQSGK